MQPRISVLISTYNARRFVAKKLEEIRSQTLFAEAEFIFVETGSEEKEREQLGPFCQRHPQCRLITTDDRRTLYAAWNLGWDAARAPLLCYSNMDDRMHPRLLEEVAGAMEERRWDACSVLIAMHSEQLDLPEWSVHWLRRTRLCPLPGPFTAWRSGLKTEVGQFDAEFFVRGDKDFWSRILARRSSIGLVPKVLYRYIERPEQLSKSSTDKERRQLDKARLSAKPYPVRWPGKIRLQVSLIRWSLRCFPRRFLPDSRGANSASQGSLA